MRCARFAPRNQWPDVILNAIGDATLSIPTLRERLLNAGHRVTAAVLYASLSRLTAWGLLRRRLQAGRNHYSLTPLGHLRRCAQDSDLPYLGAKLLLLLPDTPVHVESWRAGHEDLRGWHRSQASACGTQLVELELAVRPRRGWLHLTPLGLLARPAAQSIVDYAEYNDIPQDEPQ